MLTFAVQGMSCAHCVATVKAAILGADPAAQVEVDLNAGKVMVSHETAPASVLAAAIEAEGYEATAAVP